MDVQQTWAEWGNLDSYAPKETSSAVDRHQTAMAETEQLSQIVDDLQTEVLRPMVQADLSTLGASCGQTTTHVWSKNDGRGQPRQVI